MYTRCHGVFASVLAATGVTHFEEKGGTYCLALTRERRHFGVTGVADAGHLRGSLKAASVHVKDFHVT